MPFGQLQHIWRTEALPFIIGVFDEPQNPGCMPNQLPFDLAIDQETGVLVQVPDLSLLKFLKRAYASGSLIGTQTLF